MKKARKMVAWGCIFSTLFMGCYASSVIEPTGVEKETIYSNNIEYVVTKDGTKYEFEKAPVVANNTIVGGAKLTWYTQVNEEETSIPLSTVAFRGESPSGNIEYVVTKVGTKYMYEEPPAVVNRVIVGRAKFTGYTPANDEQVSIPLSDVAEISLSEVSAWRTLVAVALAVTVVVVIVDAVDFKFVPSPIF
jgi:hypothetical protein